MSPNAERQIAEGAYSAVIEPPPGAAIPPPHEGAPPPGTALPAHYDRCFGCGPDHPTGLKLAVTVGEGLRISAALEITDDHQGAPGLAHGGVLAAAFDEALGFLLWLLARPAVTGRLETDYLAPVPVGSRLHIDAEVTGVDGRKIYTRAVGRLGPDGPVAVRAAALFIAVPLRHFTEHGWEVPARHAGVNGPTERYNP